MKNTIITAAAALLSLSVAIPAFASSSSLDESIAGGTPTTTAPTSDGQKGERGEFRGQMHEKMRAFVQSELSQRLNLDASKTAKLADAMKAFQQRKLSQKKTAHEEMQKLQQLVDSKASDAQLKQQLAVVASAKDARVEREAFLADTAKFLTVQEQAKLEIALPQVMREAHKMRRDFRHELKGAPAAR